MKTVALVTAGLAAMLAGAAPALSQVDIPRPSLAQYRYHVDVRSCNFSLANGVRIEFDGVFATERGQQLFYQLVNFRVMSAVPAPVGTMVTGRFRGRQYNGMLVARGRAGTIFAFGTPALDSFADQEAFTIVSYADQGIVLARVQMPQDRRAARMAIAAGKSCYQDALNTD